MEHTLQKKQLTPHTGPVLLQPGPWEPPSEMSRSSHDPAAAHELSPARGRVRALRAGASSHTVPRVGGAGAEPAVAVLMLAQVPACPGPRLLPDVVLSQE